MKATGRSLTSPPRAGRAPGTVEVDAEGVVEDVGGDHHGSERGERHDLGVAEALGQASVQGVVDAVRVVAEAAAELGDQVVELVVLQRVGVLAGVDDQPPEEGRADQTVALGRDRVAEEPGAALADERYA
jgi:hypothetical protein